MATVQFFLNGDQESEAKAALKGSDCSNLNQLAKKLMLEYLSGQKSMAEQVNEMGIAVEAMNLKMSDLMQSHATLDLSALLKIMSATFMLTYNAVHDKHKEELNKYINTDVIIEIVKTGDGNG